MFNRSNLFCRVSLPLELNSPITYSLLVFVFFLASPSVVSASSLWTTEVVALTGDPAPDGNGAVSFFFSSPKQNDLGQTLFSSRLVGTTGGSSDDFAINRTTNGVITQLWREGKSAPDGNGLLRGRISAFLNNHGQAAIHGLLTGTIGGESDNEGVFLADDVLGITQHAREGQAAPDLNGVFSEFGVGITLNDKGHTAFSAKLVGTSGITFDERGIFTSDGTTITQVARSGQPTPNNDGNYFVFHEGVEINNQNQIGFQALVSNESGGYQGLFRQDETLTTRIARTGQTAPDGNGTLSEFLNEGKLNDFGEVAFFANLSGTTGGFADDDGIFRGNGTTLTQIARTGQSAPDGNGRLSSISVVKFNNIGEVAFWSKLGLTSGGASDNQGIFIGDGTSLIQIVRLGDTAPDGNGVYSSLEHGPHLNDSGQVVFGSELSGTLAGSDDDYGLFFYDETLGLTQVAREGDSLLGSTIANLDFAGNGTLNSQGQVAFLFELTDGRTGIALAALVPEPTTAALTLAATLCLVGRRRR